MFSVKKFFYRQAALGSRIITDEEYMHANQDVHMDACENPRSATDSAYGVDDSTRLDFLTELPYELASHILSFVPDVKDFARISRVSRRWHMISRDNEIWKSVFLKRWGNTVDRKRLFQLRQNPSPASSSWKGNKRRSRGQEPEQQSQAMVIGNSDSMSVNNGHTEHVWVDWKHMYKQRLHLNNNWKKPIRDIESKSISGHADSVYCIQFDNEKIVSGSRDRLIKFWDIQTGRCIRTLSGHEGSVLCLQYDHRFIVTGSSDSTIMVWDMVTGERRLILRGHSSPVLDVRFNEDKIVSCSKDFTIKVWDLHTGILLRNMEGHKAAVNAVHMHGNIVASASGDCDVRLWDITTGQCIQVLSGHQRGLACVQYDGELVVSGSNDRTIRVWDAKSGQCLKVLSGHTDLVRTLCFDKERIVSGSYDQTIRVWDQNTGECLQVIEKAHDSWVFHVQIDPSRMVSASQDKKIVIWDFGTDVPEASAFLAHA